MPSVYAVIWDRDNGSEAEGRGMTGRRHHVETSLDQRVQEAATWVRGARHAIAFTGAGISVESGIPPFRGENGLWESLRSPVRGHRLLQPLPGPGLAGLEGDLLRLHGPRPTQRRPWGPGQIGSSRTAPVGHHPEHRRPAPGRGKPSRHRVPRHYRDPALPALPMDDQSRGHAMDALSPRSAPSAAAPSSPTSFFSGR